MKVNDPVFKRIEAEITSYHETLNEMQILIETPVIIGRPEVSIVKRLQHLEELTNTIQMAYFRGSDTHKIIMEFYYWGSCKSWDELANKLNLNRKAVLTNRDEIIFSIAHKLGWA
jgi:hypothetical protein